MRIGSNNHSVDLLTNKYTCVHTQACACFYPNTRINMHASALMCTQMHLYACACLYTNTHFNMHACTLMHTKMHSHTHALTYTLVCACVYVYVVRV